MTSRWTAAAPARLSASSSSAIRAKSQFKSDGVTTGRGVESQTRNRAKRCPCIFAAKPAVLAASVIIGKLAWCPPLFSSIGDHLQRIERFSFERFEEGPPARGYVRHFIGKTKLLHSFRRFATADDRDRWRDGETFGDTESSLTERRVFELAHRPVPNYGSRLLNDIAVLGDRCWTDVHPKPRIRQIRTLNNFRFGRRLGCRGHQVV